MNFVNFITVQKLIITIMIRNWENGLFENTFFFRFLLRGIIDHYEE